MVAQGTPAVSVRDRIVDRFASSVGHEKYRRYFKDSVRVSVDRRCVSVVTPNAFVAEWFGRSYGDRMLDAARAELGDEPIDVRVGVEESAATNQKSHGVSPDVAHSRGDGSTSRRSQQDTGRMDAGLAATARASVSGTANGGAVSAPASHKRMMDRGRSMRRLDDFVVGESNELAYHAALRLLEPECPREFSPLFIHGGCGLGKTHLLQGLAALKREKQTGARVIYTTGEAFTNSFITALRSNKIDSFRAKYRAADLLLVDDIHFLSNKNATQQEFLHTFNAIGFDGSRVVLASDEHPSRIRAFSKELVSRFMAGMVVEVETPDEKTRLEITRRIAARRGLAFEEAGLRMLASRCGGSVRELEGAVTRVDAMHRLLRPEGLNGIGQGQGGEVPMHVVVRAIGGLRGSGSERPTRPIPVRVIADEVCESLQVEMSDLMGRGRHSRVVLARSATAHLSRRLTTMSYPEIARAMGRPNHSTIVTACQRVERDLEAGSRCDAGPEFGSLDLGALLEKLARRINRRAVAADDS